MLSIHKLSLSPLLLLNLLPLPLELSLVLSSISLEGVGLEPLSASSSVAAAAAPRRILAAAPLNKLVTSVTTSRGYRLPKALEAF